MTTVNGVLLIGGGVPSSKSWMRVKVVAPAFTEKGLILPDDQSVVVNPATGTWTVDCEPLPEGWAYQFEAVVGGGSYRHVRIVTMPATGTVNYEDLVDVAPPGAPAFASPFVALAQTAVQVAMDEVGPINDALMDAVAADPTSDFSIRQSTTIGAFVGSANNPHTSADAARNAAVIVNVWRTPTVPTNWQPGDEWIKL